jgi:mannitol-1-phosphate 5-dehydrogenase
MPQVLFFEPPNSENIMNKQAVIFGAGNIGRGFIGQLFSESGYKLVFIDVDAELIAALNDKGRYQLQIVNNDDCENLYIAPVSAIHASDTAAVAEALAQAHIAATAVGAQALSYVAPNLCAGLALRWAANAAPLNIVVCENLHGAAAHLRELTKAAAKDPSLCDYVVEQVGFVDTVIGRMVPAPTAAMRAADPALIRVEPYKELPVDRSGFIGAIPEISAMHAEDSFPVYTARKLYVHNCGHALLAYTGYLRGYTYAYEALADQEIRTFLLAGLRESVTGICAEFTADPAWLQNHVDELLLRFANRQLGDTLYRLGRDPLRKLAAKDRLSGAANLACAAGIAPRHLAWGIAAALFFAPEDDESAQKLQQLLHTQGLPATLEQVAGIAPNTSLAALVHEAYGTLLTASTALP